MPVEVFTPDWCRACCAGLNRRPGFHRVAAGWASPVILLMRADAQAGVTEDRAVYLDLFRGECRGARLATTADYEHADFVLAADVSGWRRILRRETDPITALMFGRLRLEKGSFSALIPYTAAAREVLDAAVEVGGVFPATPSPGA